MVTSPDPQRKKRPDTRRQELLDAATGVLLEKSPADLRVEDVTAAAGAAKGTFYRYFQTKEQLLAALRDRFVEDLLAVADARIAAAPPGDWHALVEAYVGAAVDFYLANLRVHDVLFHGVPGRPPSSGGDVGAAGAGGDVGGTEMPILRRLADFISDGVVEGAFRVRDPWLTASLVYGALHGGLDATLHAQGSVDRDRFVASAVELVTKSLAPLRPSIVTQT